MKNHVFNIFKIASHFNAIFLVNKINIFLYECFVNEVYNYSMTIFLCKFEYFEKVLFLIINCVDEFDDAILSRIHYKLKYEILNWEFQRDVWKSFLSKSCMYKRSLQLFSDELYKLKDLNFSVWKICDEMLIVHISSLIVYSSSDQKSDYDHSYICYYQ